MVDCGCSGWGRNVLFDKSPSPVLAISIRALRVPNLTTNTVMRWQPLLWTRKAEPPVPCPQAGQSHGRVAHADLQILGSHVTRLGVGGVRLVGAVGALTLLRVCFRGSEGAAGPSQGFPPPRCSSLLSTQDPFPGGSPPSRGSEAEVLSPLPRARGASTPAAAIALIKPLQ